jgi:hypothetical protein
MRLGLFEGGKYQNKWQAQGAVLDQPKSGDSMSYIELLKKELAHHVATKVSKGNSVPFVASASFTSQQVNRPAKGGINYIDLLKQELLQQTPVLRATEDAIVASVPFVAPKIDALENSHGVAVPTHADRPAITMATEDVRATSVPFVTPTIDTQEKIQGQNTLASSNKSTKQNPGHERMLSFDQRSPLTYCRSSRSHASGGTNSNGLKR